MDSTRKIKQRKSMFCQKQPVMSTIIGIMSFWMRIRATFETAEVEIVMKIGIKCG